jgi:hypothetical protein
MVIYVIQYFRAENIQNPVVLFKTINLHKFMSN